MMGKRLPKLSLPVILATLHGPHGGVKRERIEGSHLLPTKPTPQIRPGEKRACLLEGSINQSHNPFARLYKTSWPGKAGVGL
jgi:hypothetical protein